MPTTWVVPCPLHWRREIHHKGDLLASCTRWWNSSEVTVGIQNIPALTIASSGRKEKNLAWNFKVSLPVSVDNAELNASIFWFGLMSLIYIDAPTCVLTQGNCICAYSEKKGIILCSRLDNAIFSISEINWADIEWRRQSQTGTEDLSAVFN